MSAGLRPQPVRASIGLGANLGDREAALERAVAALAVLPATRVVARSTWRETAPVDCPPGSPRFLNGAAVVETRLPPAALLAALQGLELAAGRDHGAPRHAPRPLDLDLLLYGDERIDAAGLVVPHPRLHERAFVREPLTELGVAVPPPLPRPAVVRDPAAFAARCSEWLAGGCRSGLVPTMGALHAGHASLLARARATCDRVAASIFVNPRQFGPGEDYERYPRAFDADLDVLARTGCDLVFVPDLDGMYPPGFASVVAVGREAEGMEGAQRPGHFSGVATVVARLLGLARPSVAFFGHKDAQQVAVVRRLVADLGLPTRIEECPTHREPDGLAASSRNVYLAPEDRAAAPVLHRALAAARDAFRAGERRAEALLAIARRHLEAEPRAEVEYLELRAEGDLAPLDPGVPLVAGRLLVAARFGDPPTRLIDNVSLVDPLEVS